MIHLAPPTTAPATIPAILAPTTPDDLFVCPFTVYVDTREQAPWVFSNITHEKQLLLLRHERFTLTTGDYTISGCEDRFCIERKSATDFVQSVTREARRFKAEHERMATAVAHPGGFACVIIEGSLSTICDDLEADAGRRATPEMILGAVAAWPMRYGVQWFFAGDRRHAELLAWRVMWRWWCEWTKNREGDSQC